MIVKRFGCTAIHNKVLNKCLIHSFWLEHLSDFDRCCSHPTIACAIKVPREQNETSRQGQVLQLLKIVCKSLDDDTLYSHWLESVMTSGGQSTQIKYLSKSTDTYNKILLQ